MITTLLLSLLLTVAHPTEHQAVMTTYVLAERAGVSPNMAVCILLRESGGAHLGRGGWGESGRIVAVAPRELGAYPAGAGAADRR